MHTADSSVYLVAADIGVEAGERMNTTVEGKRRTSESPFKVITLSGKAYMCGPTHGTAHLTGQRRWGV